MPRRRRADTVAPVATAATAALDYIRSGFSVVPTGADKIPIVSSWKKRQLKIPAESTVIKEFSRNGARVAVVAGKVSGNLECIDFDLKGKRFEQCCELVDKDAPGLIEKLVIQQTPSTGYHVMYRCPEAQITGNGKLAFEKIKVSGPGEHELDGKSYTAVAEGNEYFIRVCSIETRGEGGYFLAAPSPGYVMKQHSLSQVPEITPAERDILVEAAKALNQWVPEPIEPRSSRPAKPGELSPGDDYNRRGDIQSLLMENGWQPTGRKAADGEHWRRPGKNKGQSATLFNNSNLYVFSTNAAPFESETNYSPFGIYACLKHNGDFNAAAKELSRQGYGIKAESQDETAAEREAVSEQNQVGDTSIYTKNDVDSTPNSAFPPLIPDQTRLIGVVTERPAEPDYIIMFKGGGLVTKRVVGSMSAAGGTGKTRLFSNIANMSAEGGKWGLFEAPEPLKVLFLCAEETQDDLDRMLWDACGGSFPENLFAASVKGKVGPLMELKDGNPARSEWWHWLDQTIINHPGLDLLLLDPKSRFYGLSENDNDHNTAWVACLEALTEKNGIAIWFSHHVPKNTKEISQWMSRGGGALIDACRTNMGMIPMSEEDGKYFGITDFPNYIKLAKNKINIGPKDIGDAYLKFDDRGRLHPAEPMKEKNEGVAAALLQILSEEPETYSRRELLKDPKCTRIAAEIKDKFPKFTRSKDLDLAVNLNLHSGMLVEEQIKVPGKKGPGRKVLRVIGQDYDEKVETEDKRPEQMAL